VASRKELKESNKMKLDKNKFDLIKLNQSDLAGNQN